MLIISSTPRLALLFPNGLLNLFNIVIRRSIAYRMTVTHVGKHQLHQYVISDIFWLSMTRSAYNIQYKSRTTSQQTFKFSFHKLTIVTAVLCNFTQTFFEQSNTQTWSSQRAVQQFSLCQLPPIALIFGQVLTIRELSVLMWVTQEDNCNPTTNQVYRPPRRTRYSILKKYINELQRVSLSRFCRKIMDLDI